MSAESPSSAISAPSSAKLQLPASCEPPGDHNPPRQASWIIFGATGHMGRSLVRRALFHGDNVTAVGRLHENTLDQMSGWHERCLGLLCDVRVRETVGAVIEQSIAHWGRVNIIANCTGYGIVAAAEDQTTSDLQNQFSTNFTGVLNILQLSIPYFRTHKIPGRYLIFSSTAGALGVPGLAPYCATKYAVEGLIESMLYETDAFGIKATLVEPGYVRLDDDMEEVYEDIREHPNFEHESGLNDGFEGRPPPLMRLDSGLRRQKAHSTPIPSAPAPTRFGHFHIHPNPSVPYASASSPSAHAKRTFIWFDKRQPTSSGRSAELIWQLGHCSYPPLRLLLGNYAVESVRDRLRCVLDEVEDWKWLHFPVGEDDGMTGDSHGGREESLMDDAGTVGSGEGGDEDGDTDALMNLDGK